MSYSDGYFKYRTCDNCDDTYCHKLMVDVRYFDPDEECTDCDSYVNGTDFEDADQLEDVDSEYNDFDWDYYYNNSESKYNN